MVEGWPNPSAAEFKRFLLMAIGLCVECNFGWICVAMRIICRKETASELQGRVNRAGAMLKNLWREWRSV